MNPIYDLPIDASWVGVEPAAWRSLPEPENHDLDDDEDVPASEAVKELLGLDPDELWK